MGIGDHQFHPTAAGAFSDLKKARQKAPSSPAPTSMPSTSR